MSGDGGGQRKIDAPGKQPESVPTKKTFDPVRCRTKREKEEAFKDAKKKLLILSAAVRNAKKRKLLKMLKIA